MYARHGRDLMGCKSPVSEFRCYQGIVAKMLAEGKGDLVRGGLKEAGEQEGGAGQAVPLDFFVNHFLLFSFAGFFIDLIFVTFSDSNN